MIFLGSSIPAFAVEPEVSVQRGESGSYWVFSKSSESTGEDSSGIEKVSQDITGAGNVSVSTTKTFSATYSASLEANAKDKILASVSASVTEKKTQTLKYSFPVPAGTTGHIEYIPSKTTVKGTLKKMNTLVLSAKSVTAKYPALDSKKEVKVRYYLKTHAVGQCKG
jgi:hypothetical protein